MVNKKRKFKMVRIESEAIRVVEDYKAVEPLSPTIPKLVNYAVLKFFTELKNASSK